MSMLTAIQLEDLPVVVKFILHSVSASDAYEVRSLNHVHSNLKKNIMIVLIFSFIIIPLF